MAVVKEVGQAPGIEPTHPNFDPDDLKMSDKTRWGSDGEGEDHEGLSIELWDRVVDSDGDAAAYNVDRPFSTKAENEFFENGAVEAVVVVLSIK